MIGRRPQTQRAPGRKAFTFESLESRKMFAADVVSLAPADDTTEVAVNTTLEATWVDPVRIGPGTGNIYLYNEDDNTLIETINVRSDQVQIDGTNVTITPSSDLPGETNISVRVDPAKFRDESTEIANATIFFEDFESVPLKNSLLVPPFDDYVVVMSGTLNVIEAGEYTFGINSDDGQTLAIDLDQNGLDLIDDEIIYDNDTHGREDRLSTCAFEDNDLETTCTVEDADDAIALDVGEYEFTYFYFDAGGGSGGEFFYAKDQQVEWNEEAFVLIGDDSQGIGLVDGITATTYKEIDGNEIGDLLAAELVIEDESLIIGEEQLEVADLAENPGGRFDVDNEIPGAAEWAEANDPSPFDFSNEGPYGEWVNDNADLIEGGTDEYKGFTWLDKEFWIAEQGDQSRTDFELAEGTVLVADPDGHDDYIDNGGSNAEECLQVLEFGPECGLFTAAVATPTIYLDGVQENSAVLKFASSWWDEDTQSAEARVDYYDSAGELIGTDVLLRWESIQASDNYKPQLDDDGNNARNEQVEIALDNPAEAASMIITFDMPYATNDWWWAIDNVEVTADVEGAVSSRIADNTTWNFTTGPAIDATPDSWAVGDFDGDDQIAFSDFQILSTNFGKQTSEPTDGDANEDGEVSFADFQILSTNFGKSVDKVFAQM